LLEWGVGLGEDVVVQTWRESESVRKVVEKGYRVLVGNYKFWVCSSDFISFFSLRPVFSFPPDLFLYLFFPFHIILFL